MPRRRASSAVAVVSAVLAVFAVAPPAPSVATVSGGAATGPHTERVSLRADGDQLRRESYAPALSLGARVVAYATRAQRVVPGDDNQRSDVFVRDRRTDVNERVSVATDGTEGDGNSTEPAISRGGRYVAFTSDASTLVAGDTNDDSDVFVHDRVTGVTERVSVSSRGEQGRFSSYSPSLSADGRFVGFVSESPDLVPGDTGFGLDVFVHDRVTGRTERVSVRSDGQQVDRGTGPDAQLSADGRYVAFESFASEFVPDDTNFSSDVFVHDRETGTTERVSLASSGAEADDSSFNPVLSAHGRFVAFETFAGNLARNDTGQRQDVYVHDRATGRTRWASVGVDGQEVDSGSAEPSISADGGLVAFYSFGVPLVRGDTNDESDVFVRDMGANTTQRASLARGGAQADDSSFAPALGPGGRHVAYLSWATNLVPGDTNAVADIFVRLRFAG